MSQSVCVNRKPGTWTLFVASPARERKALRPAKKNVPTKGEKKGEGREIPATGADEAQKVWRAERAEHRHPGCTFHQVQGECSESAAASQRKSDHKHTKVLQ